MTLNASAFLAARKSFLRIKDQLLNFAALKNFLRLPLVKCQHRIVTPTWLVKDNIAS